MSRIARAELGKANSVEMRVAMSPEHKRMLLEIGEKKYRLNGNMAHTIRLVIEDAYGQLEQMQATKAMAPPPELKVEWPNREDIE